eukprot:2482889-Rhodomonas_salina.2
MCHPLVFQGNRKGVKVGCGRVCFAGSGRHAPVYGGRPQAVNRGRGVHHLSAASHLPRVRSHTLLWNTPGTH